MKREGCAFMRDNQHYRFRSGLLMTAILFIFIPCFSEGKDLIPRAIIFEAPEKLDPLISPDGKYISYLAPIDQAMNVWVRTVGMNDDRPLTNDTKRGIMKHAWARNSKYILFVQDKNGDQNWHLFATDLEKRKTTDLTPFSDVSVGFIADSAEMPNEILIVMNKENKIVQDVYKLNIVTADIELVQKNPGNVVSWVANNNLEILGAVTVLPNGGGTLMYRDNQDTIWTEFLSWDPDEKVKSLNLTADGKYWLLLHNINSDLMRLVKKNVKTLEETVIFEPKKADIDNVFVNTSTGYPIAAHEFYEEGHWQVLDKKYENDFNYLASLRAGNFYIQGTDNDTANWLIYSLAPGKPIYYYAYSHKEMKASFLFSHRSKLEKYDLPKLETVIIPARDGLKMVSYLIKPDNAELGKAPLLIYPPPSYRQRYFPTFNTILFWLANRGYAVLVVNHRGLQGFGKKFTNAGNREWGGKIIQDIEDAVNWAVKENLADPEKVGIFGHSMGGYVALASAAFSGIDFKACVSYSGPVNLLSFVKSVPPYETSFIYDLKMHVGDYEKDADFLKKISPFFNISAFRIPCFIAQGKYDIFIKAEEVSKFAKALNSRRIPVSYIEFGNEGHGYPERRENLLAFTAAVEKFLSVYLGGEVEPVNFKEKRILKDAMKIY
jgi:dipeptidyl aminopeptidase/acylaminoacyl peptidase